MTHEVPDSIANFKAGSLLSSTSTKNLRYEITVTVDETKSETQKWQKKVELLNPEDIPFTKKFRNVMTILRNCITQNDIKKFRTLLQLIS